jgi:D-alanyl-D-alanine carboxypeptidase
MRKKDGSILYVLSATSRFGNVLYWNGYYWTKKFASGKIYKDFSAILTLKEERKEKMLHISNAEILTDKTEHLFVDDIRIEAFELFPLGEKTDEDINEL